jgi:type I restriction-modification system DNA methylase subunit
MSQMSNWLNVKSFNVKDEYYTPKILVEAIIKLIKTKP